MPASARLLQKLKETWGEDVTQDLVDWVNEAQTMNQAQFRELNERFPALETRLNERIAASETRLHQRIADSETGLNQRIAAAETKLNERITALEARVDERFGGVRLEIARLEGRVDAGIAGLRAEVAVQMRDQMKWMFVFWIGTLVPLAGLIVALGKAWL